MSPNPCLSCGACCCHYRVSFYWREADDDTPGGVPVGMTEDFNDMRRMMRGTNDRAPRCVALEGEIGGLAPCAIYERRPSVCREFPASYSDGRHNERCDKARIKYGLPPVSPADWESE
jgi:hypothetical protein